jgi:hypothetical protein
MAWYDYLSPAYDAGAIYSKASGNANPLESVSPSSLLSGAKGLVTPSTVDTSTGTAAIANSQQLQNQFGQLAQSFQGAWNPNQVGINTNNQNANIAQLQAQANGTAPSAAQMQLQQQGQRNAAGAYGMAAALQGRNPGAALRSAQQTALQTQGQTNAQAATQRASDMATAQSGLASALSGMQNQQATTRAQDLGNEQSLYANQLAAGGQQTSGAGNLMNAQATATASANAMKGGIVGGIASGLGSLSDEREKTDIHPANLDRLADALRGFTFEYKDPNMPGAAPGPRVGVMAQDAERGGPIGREMVGQGGDGFKRLDIGNGLGAALAMSAEALRRTRKAA